MTKPAPLPPSHSRRVVNSTSVRWAALCDAGTVIVSLAGLEQEKPSKLIRNFPAILRDCDGWRRDLAESGIDDLAAIMETGLSALLAINARGANCHAAAGALWQEFSQARTALLGLLPPSGALGPMRSA